MYVILNVLNFSWFFFLWVAAIIAGRCVIPASEMQKQIVCGSAKKRKKTYRRVKELRRERKEEDEVE